MFIKVCALDEIANDECRSLSFKGADYFVVRKEQGIFVFENRCPHLGTSLEFVPNQFLNIDKSLVQCSMHGALFTIDDGLCISGPCEGQQLTLKPVKIEAGHVWLEHQND